MGTKVFVSYTESDQSQAKRLAATLTSIGFEVWIAPTRLRAADSLIPIFAAIEAAEWFLVTLSPEAVQSEWVQKEVAVAIACQLRKKSPRVVPIMLATVDCPPALADLVSLDLREHHWEEGVSQLVALISGRHDERSSFVSQFQLFALQAVRLDETVAQRIMTFATVTRVGSTIVDVTLKREFEEIRERALSEINKLLDESKVSTAGKGQILRSIAAGTPLPTLDPETEPDLRRWIRQSDEMLIKLAAALWTLRRKRGITLGWLKRFITRGANRSQATTEVTWQARRLAERGIALGLLDTSTEDKSSNSEQDPSFDVGPRTATIGRLAAAFEAEHARSM